MFKIYNLKLRDIKNKLIDFSLFQNKLCIITNLESLDNFATQSLSSLNTLKEYDTQNLLEILVFPIKDYLPLATEIDIKKFSKKFFNLRFFKIQDYKCDLFEYLNSFFKDWMCLQQRQNLVKFVVKDNLVIKIYEPNESPSVEDFEIKKNMFN